MARVRVRVGVRVRAELLLRSRRDGLHRRRGHSDGERVGLLARRLRRLCFGRLARGEDREEPFAQLDQRGVCDARHVALCLGLFALRARERRGQCAVSSKEQAGTLAREVSAEEEAREVEEEAPYESGGQGGGGGG